MSGIKLRVKNTALDNLVSNLRGEVGEVVTSWTILRHLMAQERKLSSGDISTDLEKQDVAFVSIMVDKVSDEIVARLAELAESKIGRLTFYFASVKLNSLDAEVAGFSDFIQKHKFSEKRNYDISHKELPEQWSQHRSLHIPYKVLLRALAKALMLMKQIDRIFLGPASKYLWREVRKKRYSLLNPPKAAYLILPYMRLSREIRGRVIVEEMAEGQNVWTEMSTVINGQPATVYACKPWGAIMVNGEVIILDQYPLQNLSAISWSAPDLQGQGQLTPIYENRQISAKYKIAETNGDTILLVPVQKIRLIDANQMTELPNITVRLNDDLKTHFGSLEIGEVKDLVLGVSVLVDTKPGSRS